MKGSEKPAKSQSWRYLSVIW